MACNLLHINIDKCCFMYFPPNRKSLHTIEVHKKSKKKNSRMYKQREIQKTGLSISIASEPVKEVTEAKFLGVWFDPMLIWNVHIRNIRNKLVSSIAIIKRILPFIPKANHKSIYHTLFESHLAYCISVWGGASKQLINSLYVTQKRLVRLIFGNTEAFLNKFCTSARTRPLNEQILGHEFYRIECTKPLFHKNKILTIHNLYTYMCVNEIAKVITNKSPIILSESITISPRNNIIIIILPNNPIACNQFLYASSSKWNFFVKKLKVPI